MKTAEIVTLFEIAHHKQCLIQVDYKVVTDMRELNSNRFFNKTIIRIILIITKKNSANIKIHNNGFTKFRMLLKIFQHCKYQIPTRKKD